MVCQEGGASPGGEQFIHTASANTIAGTKSHFSRVEIESPPKIATNDCLLFEQISNKNIYLRGIYLQSW